MINCKLYLTILQNLSNITKLHYIYNIFLSEGNVEKTDNNNNTSNNNLNAADGACIYARNKLSRPTDDCDN